jgi:hypothetical protein
MKLSITQIVLGALIVTAACYIVGWMIFGAESLLNMPVPGGDDGVSRMTRVVPEHENLFTAARYASGLLFGLGLVVLLVGSFRNRTALGKKPALTQVVAGVLIAAVSVFITRWGYPATFIIPMPEGSNLVGHVNINPGPPMIFASFLTMLLTLLGLAVLGTGIAQYIKARRLFA